MTYYLSGSTTKSCLRVAWPAARPSFADFFFVSYTFLTYWFVRLSWGFAVTAMASTKAWQGTTSMTHPDGGIQTVQGKTRTRASELQIDVCIDTYNDAWPHRKAGRKIRTLRVRLIPPTIRGCPKHLDKSRCCFCAKIALIGASFCFHFMLIDTSTID